MVVGVVVDVVVVGIGSVIHCLLSNDLCIRRTVFYIRLAVAYFNGLVERDVAADPR